MMHHNTHAATSLLIATGLWLALWVCTPVEQASAQRPYLTYDPFNRGETARRSFYDGYAVAAEVSYRSTGTLQEGRQAINPGFGVSLRFDYEVLPHLDAGAIIDAPTGNTGRTLTLSWVVLKYYQTIENTDYALRVAVDPSIDGRLGFPQADIAFISTTLLSPALSSDYSLGVRHVRLGYEQFVPRSDPEAPTIPEPSTRNDILFTRAIGWEIHFMMQYSLLLDPARSSVFTSLLVDRGQYSLFETSLRQSSRDAAGTENNKPGNGGASHQDGNSGKNDEWGRGYQGGAVWLRSGVEYNRPGYQLQPFFSIPLTQWIPDEEDISRARLSVGIRMMLR